MKDSPCLLIATSGEINQAQMILAGREPRLPLRLFNLFMLLDCTKEGLLGLLIEPGFSLGPSKLVENTGESLSAEVTFGCKITGEAQVLEGRVEQLESRLHAPSALKGESPGQASLLRFIRADLFTPLLFQVHQ